MNENKNNEMSRRTFLRRSVFGLAGLTAGVSGLASAKEVIEYAEGKKQKPVLITQRKNPRNGDKVGILGYGMMRLPRGEDHQVLMDMVNQEVDYALAHGVNYFDTAPAYGDSEEITGKALSRHPRKSYYLATKLSDVRGEPTFEKSVESYKRSLKRLQTDYIDYYLLHCIGTPNADRFRARFVDNGVLDYLVEERKKGHIRQLGFSFHGDFSTFQWCVDNNDKYKFDFVQIQMNYVDWRHASGGNTNAEQLYALAEQCGWNVIIMEPLQGGRLVNVPKHIDTRMKEKFGDDVKPAELAFRWCGTYPKVLTSLSGMTYLNILEENVATHTPLKPMNEEELAFMEDTARLMLDKRAVACNNCSYCMPCHFKVNIPGVFKYYNDQLVAGNIIRDRSAEGFAEARDKYLAGWQQFPEGTTFDACVKCGHCVRKCPQQIDIPAKMDMLKELQQELQG
ncbi:MAG: aldo/keto reductase [Bacteroidaceae bacterium]|nr:aldo/keto reductase [Bacteroidaceae bacterium]